MDFWQIAKRLGKGILRRRKRLAALTLIAATLAFGAAAYYLSSEPPRFRTSATILLEARPDRIPLFQELSPSRPLPVQLAILRSRSLAENVIQNLSRTSLQDLIENPYYVDYTLKIKNILRRLRDMEPEVENPQLRALRELQQARAKFDSKGNGIVDITVDASKPQVALDIAGSYIDALLSRTRSFNVDDARVSREFLEQQLGEVKKNLAGSEETLRGFSAAHGGVKIPDQSQATVARLSQTENALAEAQATKRIVQTRLQGLREKLGTQKEMPAPAAPTPGPGNVAQLRNQLTQLETALLDLRLKYTEEHPRVRFVKDRIAEVQHQLGDVIKETTPLTPALGAVPPAERTNFAELLVNLETAQHSLSAQEEALRKQAEALRRNLSGLSGAELQYGRLTREVDSNRNLYALLSDKLQGARIREQGEMRVVKVIDPPGVPTPATSEKRLKLMALAFLLAIAVGGGVPAAVEWIYRPVESEDDARAVTGLPVLAVIPRVSQPYPRFVSAPELDDAGRLNPNWLFVEAFRSLRVALQLAMRGERLHTFLIASPFPGDGKSTVLVNLGLAFREAGWQVVLADTDFQRPTLHRAMNVAQHGGLVEALHGKGSAEAALSPVGDGMWLATRGASFRPETRAMLATNRLKELLADMASKADIVLCDSSPVLLIPDNLFLGAAVDGVILVAKAGHTAGHDLARTKSLLEGAGARVLGIVLNEAPTSTLGRDYIRYYKTYIRSETR